MTERSDRLEVDGASCALYWEAPSWNGDSTVAIGDFCCANADVGAALLADAAARAKRRGVNAVIGPMNQDTWSSYRIVTVSDGSPCFPLEPVSGPHDLAAFLSSGFAPVQRYVSTRVDVEHLNASDLIPPTAEAVVSWTGHDPEALLARLFHCSSETFASAAFFRPIDIEAFIARYAPIIASIDPEFVLLANPNGHTLDGFLFAFPAGDSLVIKTYASRCKGVGRRLVDGCHARAKRRGFKTIIHALMRDDNPSYTNSRRYGAQVFREYALMGRRLDEAEYR